VHQKCFAAAGRHPEGQLVELRPGLNRRVQRGDPVLLGFVFVVLGDLIIQRLAKLIRLGEIPIEIDLVSKDTLTNIGLNFVQHSLLLWHLRLVRSAGNAMVSTERIPAPILAPFGRDVAGGSWEFFSRAAESYCQIKLQRNFEWTVVIGTNAVTAVRLMGSSLLGP
jgi:hypothetical protein